MIELTKQQIIKQNFVDNQIYELINKLLPANKQIKWDIELIGGIRESIYRKIINKQGIMNEAESYPFIKY